MKNNILFLAVAFICAFSNAQINLNDIDQTETSFLFSPTSIPQANYIYYASGTANSLGVIESSASNVANLVLVAKNKIILKPGFKSTNNFKAVIQSFTVSSKQIDNKNDLKEVLDSSKQNEGNNDLEELLIVKLFPNPTKNFTSIQSNAIINSIMIFDYRGRVVKVIKSNSTQAILDISKYESGLYLLHIYTENGRKIEKLVKE